MSMFNSLRKSIYAITLATALSLGAACGIHPNEPKGFPNQSYNNYPYQPNEDTSKIPFEITSTPLTSATVDVPYEYKIDGNEPIKQLFLLENPIKMTHEKDIISYTAIHLGNKNVKLVAHSIFGGYNMQEFIIQVAPGEFFRHPGLKYDHIQRIGIASDSTEYNDLVTLLCEEPCLEVYSEDYLNKKATAINLGLTRLKEIIQKDVSEDKKPIEIHLNNDSDCSIAVDHCYYYFLDGKYYDECPDPTGKNCINKCYAGYADVTTSTICTPKYNRVLAGLDGTCLDNSVDKDGKLIHPEVCKYPINYTAPDSIKSVGLEIHEYTHLINRFNNSSSGFGEVLAHALPFLIIGDSSHPDGFDSFCDFPKGSNTYLTYIKKLCEQCGFDRYVLPEFYDITTILSESKGGNLTNIETKSVVDYLTGTCDFFCVPPVLCN